MPRHVGASRDFHFIFSERAGWGGRGGRCQPFYFLLFSLFSRPRAGLATVKGSFVFFGLATNTLNVRNNNNHQLVGQGFIFYFL